MPNWTRGAVAFAILMGSLLLAQVGLVDLISKGYGWITWLVIAVYVAPAVYKGVPLLLSGIPGEKLP